MSLIKSISGIRGTIGGKAGDALTPTDLVRFVSSYAKWVRSRNDGRCRVVIGRDARVSGSMVRNIVVGTLMGMGIDVIDIGLATTPTTELAVCGEKAQGGIIITASHNPMQWNALKLLNDEGEFLNADEGAKVLALAANEDYEAVDVHELGSLTEKDYSDYHIDRVLNLKLVDVEAIRASHFKVAVDAVNSVGGIILPKLLKRLGVEMVHGLNMEPDGLFAHNPEPLPQNLTDISALVVDKGFDVGFVVDPDVDRLALICEDGSMFGEEYTIVCAADYVLENTPGSTVSNLSSSRALRDVSASYGQSYAAAAVGEVNVVAQMKATGAVIGGEGNGGVIYPECHYGRDALVGIALILSHLAKKHSKLSQLRDSYPQYVISKNRIDFNESIDVDALLDKVKDAYSQYQINDVDGVKIDFPDSWVHLRKSNTEPIIRIYAEARTEEQAAALAQNLKDVIVGLV